ncbi:hypothetical protein IAQ61_003090 [Plenodomus lingam]|uniref:uncharacterized protein n=1 Tax=Leptosphaeria maculans TaxID=5022 RepID=UPI00332BE00E|nr:hypothetical protein IAQ61_003090 [Plenodomus lingam]
MGKVGSCAQTRPRDVNPKHQHHDHGPKQRVIMATLHRERVQHALNELLVRIVPEDPEEDEDTANQRFEDAFDFAMETLTGAGDAALVPDVHHIASLIDQKGNYRRDP